MEDRQPIQQGQSTQRNANGCIVALLVALILMVGGLFVFLVARDAIGALLRPEPTPTPRPTIVTILGLSEIAELATVDIRSVAEVPEVRTPENLLRHFGGRESLLMLVYGDVKVGFDLSKIEEGDLWVNGKRVQLRLPPPEILATTIDFDKSHIVDYERSFLVENDPNLQAVVLERGTEDLQQAAIEAGAFELAKRFGKLFFENHLRSLGFEEVRIETD